MNKDADIFYTPLGASDMVKEGKLKNRSLIIVDPPRKGLDEDVVKALVSNDTVDARTLVYVSCGFKAFQRDYKALTENNVWSLTKAEGFILFPGADHIETLAIFKRNK